MFNSAHGKSKLIKQTQPYFTCTKRSQQRLEVSSLSHQSLGTPLHCTAVQNAGREGEVTEHQAVLRPSFTLGKKVGSEFEVALSWR